MPKYIYIMFEMFDEYLHSLLSMFFKLKTVSFFEELVKG